MRRSAEHRREELVSAAVRVIAEHGALGATTRLIAEEAQAPLAALHYCFGSKASLFDAVFDVLARRPYERDLAPDGIGLAASASGALERAVAWYVDRPDWARARLELFFWAVHAGEGAVAVRAYDLQCDALREEFERACGGRDDLTVAADAARLVIAMVDGLLLQWTSVGDGAALADEVQRSAAALVALLEPARPPRPHRGAAQPARNVVPRPAT